MSDEELQIVYENVLRREEQDSEATVEFTRDPSSSSATIAPRISLDEAIKIKAQARQHITERYKALASNQEVTNCECPDKPTIDSLPTNKINETTSSHAIRETASSKTDRPVRFASDYPKTKKAIPSCSYPTKSRRNIKRKSISPVRRTPRRKSVHSNVLNLRTNIAIDEEPETMSSVTEIIALINNNEYCFRNLKLHAEVVFSSNSEKFFSVEEMTIVNSFFSMNKKCRDLYKDMYARKYKWRKLSDYQFNNTLYSNVKTLFEKKFILNWPDWSSSKDPANARLDGLLEILSMVELRKVCESSGIQYAASRKKLYVKKILEHVYLHNKSSDMKVISAEDILKSVKNIVADCFILSPMSYGLFKRIHLLFMVKHSEKENDSSFLLDGSKYPDYYIISKSDLFSSRTELLRFQTAAEIWSEFSEHIDDKEWYKADSILKTVRVNFLALLSEEDNCVSALPLCLREYSSGSLYAYMLHRGIEIQMTLKENEQAIENLGSLVGQKDFLPYMRGHWFEQLIKIHKLCGQYEQMAKVIDTVMRDSCFPEETQLQFTIVCSSREALTKKIRLSSEDKEIFKSILGSIPLTFPMESKEPNEINVQYDRNTGWKQLPAPNGKELFFTTVEDLLKTHYCSSRFNNGMYDGSNLVLSLFGILFWDIIYDQNVPWAFTRKFLRIPMDLCTGEFYKNRKDLIDKKLNQMFNWTVEYTTFLVTKTYSEKKNTISLVKWTLFPDSNCILNIINCIGWEIVVNICGRIAKEYRFASIGFPQFFVWSPAEKKSKFVQVQYSKDPLGTTQKLWRNFLLERNANFENCRIVVKRKKAAEDGLRSNIQF